MNSLEISVLRREEDPLLSLQLSVSRSDRLVLENPLKSLPNESTSTGNEHNCSKRKGKARRREGKVSEGVLVRENREEGEVSSSKELALENLELAFELRWIPGWELKGERGKLTLFSRSGRHG